jgi:hypothetical protein
MHNSILELEDGTSEQKAGMPRVGFIGAMPRSGTWYISMTLRFYNELLQGKALSVPSHGQTYAQSQTALGVEHIAVVHTLCPGFTHYQGPHRAAWDRLTFFSDSFDIADEFMEKTAFLTDPASNPQARIGYLYRNPLDQAVSFYHHSLSSKTLGNRMAAYAGPRAYFFDQGLDSYIKQFLSYWVMKETRPDQVELIRYEDLLRSPKPTLEGVLRFLGHDPSSTACQEKLDMALAKTSMEGIREMESLLGHSLANDQRDASSSHIKDGRIGKWKDTFQPEDMKTVENRLAEFEIPMEIFTWE